MKKIVIIALLFIGVEEAYAQEELTATQHYSQIYQRALRYNDISAAKNALYNLVSMYPQNDSLLYSLSVIYFQTQQYASAALTARDVLTLNPNNIGAIELSAISFENIGAQEKAIEAYENLYLQTDDYQALYKMAFLQYEADKLDQALTNADILLNRKESAELTVTFTGPDKQPKDYPIKAAIFNLKGLIAKEQGKTEEARNFFNQALEISPEFTMAKENLNELSTK
ncbi:MAG: tetratricopeptide repeat protein [Candidatus Cyclobacteriaceae bacterium M2_1C_046]